MRVIGTPEDMERMRYIRTQVEKTILPYRGNTEAAIVVCALMQTARVLLNLYPEATQKQLLEALVPFITGERLPGANLLGERKLLIEN